MGVDPSYFNGGFAEMDFGDSRLVSGHQRLENGEKLSALTAAGADGARDRTDGGKGFERQPAADSTPSHVANPKGSGPA